VCVAKNGGAMSGRRASGGIGLDYEVSQALADKLSLGFEPVWFESEQDSMSSPAKEAVAMLSYGLCDVVPGFALYAPDLGPFPGETSPVPRWDDRPTFLGPQFQLPLEPFIHSRPYARIEMGLVVRSDLPQKERAALVAIRTLSDLPPVKVGVQQGTLAGILTLRQGTPKLVAQAVTLTPGPQFLWEMENGAFDAALVSVPEYDFHARQNRLTKLELTGYRHPIGFNIGFIALAKNADLMARIDGIIADMVKEDAVSALAAKSDMHYAPPTEPAVRPAMSIVDILNTR